MSVSIMSLPTLLWLIKSKKSANKRQGDARGWFEIKQGTSNRSSSKNPSTSFTICLFTNTEDSNPVIYSELHIEHISSPYGKIIMSVKFCQPVKSGLSQEWITSTIFTSHIC